MKLKYTLSILALLGLLACKKQIANKEKELDWNSKAKIVLNEITPKLITTWKITEIHVTPFKPNTSEIGIFKDTTLYNFGELKISKVDKSQDYSGTNNVSGVISFKNKFYPVGVRIFPTDLSIAKKQGPQIGGLFEFRFPDGSHRTEPEEAYLSSLTFIDSQFQMEVSADGKTMIWTSTDRAIKKILFEKD